MAISFPTGLDNFTNPSSGNTLDSPSHSLQHSDLNDAVEALERKVGLGTAVAGSASAGQVLTISAAGTSTWTGIPTQGLIQVVPTSISVGSGSGSVDSNGLVTFTGVSSVSLNGCFTSTYRNYRIFITAKHVSDADLTFRVRASGTDLSSSNSYYQGRYYVGETSSLAAGSGNASLQTSWDLNRVGTWASSMVMDISNPQATEVTNAFTASSGAYFQVLGQSLNNNTTSYDGFTIISGNSMTGTVSVYGYK